MDPERSPGVLRALAHPLRVRLLMQLREGAATSAILARRTAQTRGNVSYHLRSLARAGLIEEDCDEGTVRERWWRLVSFPEVDAMALSSGADVADAAESVMSERGRRLARFAERLSTGKVPPDRVRATRVSELRFHLSAARQAELVAEIDALLTRWEHVADQPGEDGEAVEVQLAIFSVGPDE